jgi:hypothetical protein
MQQETESHVALGCLRSLLLNIFALALACYISFLCFGKKGLLAGIGAYLTMPAGKLFLRVFGRTQRTPDPRPITQQSDSSESHPQQ